MPNDSIKLVITPNGGSATTKTLKLARGQNGACLFKSYDLAVDDQRHDLPIWTQTDWSAGIGHSTFTNPAGFAEGSCIDTSYPGQFFLGPLPTTATAHDGGSAGRPYAWEYFAGLLYVSTLASGPTNTIYTYSTTDSHFDSLDTTATLAVNLRGFGSYIFAALGTTQPYEYSSGAGFTACTLTDHHASGFCVAPSPAVVTDILWKYDAVNGIASNTSGINGGAEWTPTAYIGESDMKITSMWLHQNNLMIGKEDGLFHYTTDGQVHRLMTSPKHSSNYKYVTQFHGNSYFSLFRHIGELTANNVLSLIGPYVDQDDIGKVGVCTGLTADDHFLYAVYTSGNATPFTYEIFKAWPYTTTDGGRKWAWCPIYNVAASSSTEISLPYIWDRSASTTQLWFAGNADPKYLLVQENPTSYSTSTYNSAGYLVTSWIDLGHRDWYKLIDAVLAECRGTLDANKTVTLSYEADEAGSWTQIDTAYTAATAGTKKYTDTAPVAAKKVRFKIALATNSSASTPIVKYVAAYGSVKPDRVRIFETTVLAEEGFSSRPETLRDFLIDGRDSRNLITLTDRFNNDHYVRILPGYPIEEELTDKYGQSVGIGMHVKMEKVDWS